MKCPWVFHRNRTLALTELRRAVWWSLFPAPTFHMTAPHAHLLSPLAHCLQAFDYDVERDIQPVLDFLRVDLGLTTHDIRTLLTAFPVVRAKRLPL